MAPARVRIPKCASFLWECPFSKCCCGPHQAQNFHLQHHTSPNAIIKIIQKQEENPSKLEWLILVVARSSSFLTKLFCNYKPFWSAPFCLCLSAFQNWCISCRKINILRCPWAPDLLQIPHLLLSPREYLHFGASTNRMFSHRFHFCYKALLIFKILMLIFENLNISKDQWQKWASACQPASQPESQPATSASKLASRPAGRLASQPASQPAS